MYHNEYCILILLVSCVVFMCRHCKMLKSCSSFKMFFRIDFRIEVNFDACFIVSIYLSFSRFVYLTVYRNCCACVSTCLWINLFWRRLISFCYSQHYSCGCICCHYLVSLKNIFCISEVYNVR